MQATMVKQELVNRPNPNPNPNPPVIDLSSSSSSGSGSGSDSESEDGGEADSGSGLGKRARVSDGERSDKGKKYKTTLPLGFLDPLPRENGAAPAAPPPVTVVHGRKAGDYNGSPIVKDSLTVDGVGMDHVRVHPKFTHSNATSHKRALGAFAELLDNSLDEMSKSNRPSKKSILSRFFSKSVDKRRGESSSQDPDDYIQQGTQRAMDIASLPGKFSPKLIDEEIENIPLPGELVSEAYQRDKDYAAALTRFNARQDEIQALIQHAHERIDAALAEGQDLSMFLKKPKTRGAALFFTKVDKQRRVVLEWDASGHPIGPGSWGVKFNEAIGCLVRVRENWDVAFTFNSNPYSAFKNTWIELLRYFVLEDDVDWRWKYVRTTMHDKFKQYRDRLKMKYLKSPFEEDWQRFYSIPSTVSEESFAYLLLYWNSDKVKEEAARNSANRRRNENPYYGGSVSIPSWRFNVDAAGGDASLSTSWQVLHTSEGMSEEQLQAQRHHWEHFVAEEQTFREANPDYPAERSILPVAVESSILQHEFPNAAAKGQVPILGGSMKLTHPTSRGRPSAARGYYFSQEAQKIQELQAQLMKTNEAMQTRYIQFREEMQARDEQLRSEILSQVRSQLSQHAPLGPYYQSSTQSLYYPPQPPPPQSSQKQQYILNRDQYEQYQRFLDWQRSMCSGSGESNK